MSSPTTGTCFRAASRSTSPQPSSRTTSRGRTRKSATASTSCRTRAPASTRQRYELLLEILAEQAVPEGTPTDPGTGSKYVYRRRPELPRKSSLAGTLKHAADMATKHERLAAVAEDIVFAHRQGKSPDLTQLQTAVFDLRGYEPRDCPTGCGGISVAQSGGGVACTHCTWWFCY